MNNQIIIAEGDPALVFSFILDLARYEKLEHQVTATEEDIRQLLKGPHPAAEALIASYNGEPAGYALFFHNVSTFAGRRGLYLEDLYVKPVYRRKGIGQALLAKTAQIAVERNCARFEWTALDWNKPALAFYESLGAGIRKEWLLLRVEGTALTALAEQASR